MLISQSLASKNNNFNLIRLCAAVAVLVSHSFTVVSGDANTEPMRQAYGMTLGSIAVEIFFFVSGLLVTNSMYRSNSAIEFLVARATRICPGLTVSLLVTAGLAAVIFFGSATAGEVLYYVARNSIPYGSLENSFGNVFSTNPAGPGFNASLWTLPEEVRMYRNIFLLWVLSIFAKSSKKLALDAMVLGTFAYFSYKHLSNLGTHFEDSPFRLPFTFMAGAACFVLAARIKMTWSWLAVVLVLFLSVPHASTGFAIIYSILLMYATLCLSYLLKGPILKFDRVGDYSYGMYVYAWPIQQALTAINPDMGVALHIVLSFIITLIFATLSWHLVERPALRLKNLSPHFRRGTLHFRRLLRRNE